MSDSIPILGRNQVIDPVVCPHCGEQADAVRDERDVPRRPSPGDVLMCAACGWPLALDQGLRARPVNANEAFKLAAEPQFLVSFFMRWAALNVEGFIR